MATKASNLQATESAAEFMRRIKAIDVLQCPNCALVQLKIIQMMSHLRGMALRLDS